MTPFGVVNSGVFTEMVARSRRSQAPPVIEAYASAGPELPTHRRRHTSAARTETSGHIAATNFAPLLVSGRLAAAIIFRDAATGVRQ